MSEPQSKLPHGADELLRDFPVAEPDFEAQARAIEARLGTKPEAGAPSDDDLFKAPELGAELAEPPLPSQIRAAPKGHLAEMARRSLQKPNDDAAALAKELLAATARSRRPDAELVERVRAAGKSAATATPLPVSEPRPERHSGVVPRAEPSPAPQPTSDKRGVVIALVGVALAAAAAFALFAAGTPEASPTSAAVAAEQASQARANAEATRPAPVAAPPSEGVVSPDALPPALATEAEAKPAEPMRGGGKPSVATSKPVAAPAPSTAPQPVELADDEPTPVAAAPEPKAKPAEEPPLLPAQGNTGSVPLNPSSGAVSTALGSVRGGAQACLAGQTEAVTATVTFASGGHVLRVSAGGPSGACIQAALSKAKISPFAKESFSATTTIRPP